MSLPKGKNNPCVSEEKNGWSYSKVRKCECVSLLKMMADRLRLIGENIN